MAIAISWRLAMEAILFALLISAQNPQAKAPEPASAPTSAEKVECRKVEVTGSRLAVRRICLTPSEWAQRTDSDIEATRDIQRPRGLPVE
jgi:predicted secreted protein